MTTDWARLDMWWSRFILAILALNAVTIADAVSRYLS